MIYEVFSLYNLFILVLFILGDFFVSLGTENQSFFLHSLYTLLFHKFRIYPEVQRIALQHYLNAIGAF